jgi:hypothetical protein
LCSLTATTDNNNSTTRDGRVAINHCCRLA